ASSPRRLGVSAVFFFPPRPHGAKRSRGRGSDRRSLVRGRSSFNLKSPHPAYRPPSPGGRRSNSTYQSLPPLRVSAVFFFPPRPHGAKRSRGRGSDRRSLVRGRS